jgi:enterochelin esterase-like enzyme
MGGGQALNIGLRHADTFAWIGAFSAAPNTKRLSEISTAPGRLTENLRLLWISCGDKDQLFNISQEFHEALKKNSIPHVWHADSGGHDWSVWKSDLYFISQKLFQ